MRRRGFTIIELVIVITVMAALIALGVVNLRSSQANGRDTERKTDVESIAQQLEAYYTSGTDNSTDVGGYPSTSITATQNAMTTALRDVDTDSLTAPGLTDPMTPTQTFIPASCSGACVQTTAGVTPQPNINQYVYQPLHSDGTLCNDAVECRKFNLFYRQEVDNNVIMVTSLNQ
ncbi:MAG: type II secretion system protein [Candidatus Saccharibacteria bacterium]|nr:type II secretion system protein [Candidatus Saccharibacteria bacterium]